MNDILAQPISPNMQTTPEGYLLCRNVPIARVGIQTYSTSENITDIDGKPLPPDGNGHIQVYKSENVLFDPDAIASFQGKPVTIGHVMLDTNNWKENSVGYGFNVRRGEGEFNNHLMADLLLQDAAAIDMVKNNLVREISLGYDAAYVSDGAGIAHQEKIIGNHIAIVPQGKAGHSCRIFDQKLEGTKMPKENSLKEKLLNAINSAFTEDASGVTINLGQGQPAQPQGNTQQGVVQATKANDELDPLSSVNAKLDALIKAVTSLAESIAGAQVDKTVDKKTSDACGDKDKTGDELPLKTELELDKELTDDDDAEIIDLETGRIIKPDEEK